MARTSIVPEDVGTNCFVVCRQNQRVRLSQRLPNGRMCCGGAHLCMNLLILIVLNYPTPGSDSYFELIFLGIISFQATSSSIITLLLR